MKISIGTILDCRELICINQEDYIIIPRLHNCTQAPLQGDAFLSALTFQRLKETLASAVLLQKTDCMMKAFSRIITGYAPESGTNYPEFLEERAKLMKEPPIDW